MKNKYTQHNLIPIQFLSLDEYAPECHGFSGIIFSEDFGPYKKGQKINTIWINFESGKIECYEDNSGHAKHVIPFTIKI